MSVNNSFNPTSPLSTQHWSAQLEPLFHILNNTLSWLELGSEKIPGSAIVFRYIKSSHQNDPFRTVLEVLLVFFIIRTWMQSRTRAESSGKNFVKLTEKEIDELVSEWQPEPLVGHIGPSLSAPPIILGPTSTNVKVVLPNTTTSSAFPSSVTSLASASSDSIGSTSSGALVQTSGNDRQHSHSPKSLEKSLEKKSIQVINLASTNFAGLAGNERIKEKAIECSKTYGVGSCGPPGFYGTFDVHMDLERDIADFLGMQAAIIYAHGFSTISSVIASFSKRGDLIVADRGVNFAIQKGIQISRSNVKWYDHNDMGSLERVLDGIVKEDKKYRRKITRRFIITEGLFENDGQVLDLPKVLELKKRYKFRLMLDETWSFGSMGKTGRGLTEVFEVPAKEVDFLIGSMAVGLCAGGGFCAGSSDVVYHQRINSPALVFSAALPPLLAVSSSEAMSILRTPTPPGSNGTLPLSSLPENVRLVRTVLDKIESIEIPSHPSSPLIHIQIRDSSFELSLEAQEKLLQDVVDDCIHNGLLVTRAKKIWDWEIQNGYQGRPSIRVCVSAALTKRETEKAGGILKNSLVKVLGKKR